MVAFACYDSYLFKKLNRLISINKIFYYVQIFYGQAWFLEQYDRIDPAITFWLLIFVIRYKVGDEVEKFTANVKSLTFSKT